MSEITRGIPENVIPTATVISIETAREKYRGEKSTQTAWFKPYRQPPPENQNGITPVKTRTGEILPDAGSKGTVIDFQAAREKRLRKAGEIQESTPFTQTDATKKDADQTEYAPDPDEEQSNALRIVRSKLAQFDVPTEKRSEIFENLADDPVALSKVAGVVMYFFKPQRDYGAELEESAAFRKRIIDALKNKQQVDQETEKKLSGLGLLMVLLGSLFKGSVNAVAGEELEQIGLKEKESQSA